MNNSNSPTQTLTHHHTSSLHSFQYHRPASINHTLRMFRRRNTPALVSCAWLHCGHHSPQDWSPLWAAAAVEALTYPGAQRRRSEIPSVTSYSRSGRDDAVTMTTRLPRWLCVRRPRCRAGAWRPRRGRVRPAACRAGTPRPAAWNCTPPPASWPPPGWPCQSSAPCGPSQSETLQVAMNAGC
jgi:hypothetical protein